MKRVLVIGNCGSGKSTFSKKLAERTGLPLLHLDQYYYQPDWKETAPEVWKTKVETLCQKNLWIIDGNYGGTLDLRIQYADTIIFLNQNTLTCLWHITKRILKYYNTVRPDMAKGCKERFDWNFYKYVARFNKTRRPALLEKLKSCEHNKTIFIFSNDSAISAFLKSL